jgi:hypothetical protein
MEPYSFVGKESPFIHSGPGRTPFRSCAYNCVKVTVTVFFIPITLPYLTLSNLNSLPHTQTLLAFIHGKS